MLDFLAFSWIWQQPVKLERLEPLRWHQAEIFILPDRADDRTEKIVRQYVDNLANKGLSPSLQGVWLQSEGVSLGSHQGKNPLAAASLTKIATTLAALETWGHSHQFETSVYTTGSIDNGTLKGNLIVFGGGDPLFVWEEAIALANAIEKTGIRRVEGNLIVVGDFYLNFKSDRALSAKLLRVGLNSALWSRGTWNSYTNMPPGTLKPNLEISGSVLSSDRKPKHSKPIVRRKSLPLSEILRQMNIYSNNYMAQMLTDLVGGGQVVAKIALGAAKVPPTEINLINGSGLGVDNRLSPRAVCAMLMAIETRLKSESVSVIDLFPVAGRDRKGTLKNRSLPEGTAVKTGSLSGVSALAGVIPTREKGLVWFAIINHGNKDLDLFRAEQDRLLDNLSQHWQVIPSRNNSHPGFFGDPSRNVIGTNE
ncbi:MAG: D-alanyl-D-alanine carboxypeptidase/D-alanyl-D-alanine-endopeptidase [Prochloraceae cyanobacterium]